MVFKNTESVSANWKSDKSSLLHMVKSYILCTKVKLNMSEDANTQLYQTFLPKNRRDALLKTRLVFRNAR